MTSWVWMKGIETALADPIDPVCPEDDRPAVKDLIKEHSSKIEKIREALLDHPLYDIQKHDDLWILRFWMSHKKSQLAIDAAKHTLELRKEYGLDDRDIRLISPHQVESGKIREYMDCCKEDAVIFTHPHPERGVICFLKIASLDQQTMVDKLTEDHWLESFMYSSEWAHQWLDYVTRTTGRLTRSVRFIDLNGMKMSSLNRECSRRDGKAMGLMEDCYPQLLESLFVCNPPTFIDVMWKVFRVFLPKRVVSKFDFVNPQDRPSDRKKFYRHISDENLPDFYGGKNPIPPHDWKNHIALTSNKLDEKNDNEFHC